VNSDGVRLNRSSVLTWMADQQTEVMVPAQERNFND